MKIITLVFILLGFISCGESPLLNHELEKNGLTDDFFPTRAENYQFKKTKFHFTLDWLTGPLKGESKFILRSWHEDRGTLSGPFQDLPENLHIYLWMTSMGHGSSPVKIKKMAAGEYEVSSVYFIMGGQWDIHFQLLNKENIVDEVILPITL